MRTSKIMKLTQVWVVFIGIVNLLCGKVYGIDNRYIFVPAIIACGFGIIIPVVYMVAGKNIFIAEDTFCILKIRLYDIFIRKMKLFVNVQIVRFNDVL